MHFTLSRLRLRYPSVCRITEGTSQHLKSFGGFDENQMARSRSCMQDLAVEMRQQGCRTLDEVESIIAEHNGSITILTKPYEKDGKRGDGA